MKTFWLVIEDVNGRDACNPALKHYTEENAIAAAKEHVKDFPRRRVFVARIEKVVGVPQAVIVPTVLELDP